jgi:hypothetical protein
MELKKNNTYGYEYYELSTTNDQIEQSIDFAERYVHARKDHYSKNRKQSKPEVIKEQKIYGTCFEFAVYNLLKKFGDLDKPDTTIWTGQKKDPYERDLLFTGKSGHPLNIHIKSQELKKVSKRFPISFGFQARDPLVSNPELNDYIFGGLCFNKKKHHLMLKIRAADAVGRYGEPIKKDFRGDKKFLYIKDLKKHGIKLI